MPILVILFWVIVAAVAVGLMYRYATMITAGWKHGISILVFVLLCWWIWQSLGGGLGPRIG